MISVGESWALRTLGFWKDVDVDNLFSLVDLCFSHLRFSAVFNSCIEFGSSVACPPLVSFWSAESLEEERLLFLLIIIRFPSSTTLSLSIVIKVPSLNILLQHYVTLAKDVGQMLFQNILLRPSKNVVRLWWWCVEMDNRSWMSQIFMHTNHSKSQASTYWPWKLRSRDRNIKDSCDYQRRLLLPLRPLCWLRWFSNHKCAESWNFKFQCRYCHCLSVPVRIRMLSEIVYGRCIQYGRRQQCHPTHWDSASIAYDSPETWSE